jgi:hypothetical protein
MSEPAQNMTESLASTPDMSDSVATESPAVSLAPESSDWRMSLPPELRENPTIKDTPSVETLAKRLVDTKSMLGNSIRVPGPDASEEDRQKFLNTLLEKDVGLMQRPDPTNDDSVMNTLRALGLPEKPDEYYRPEDWVGVDENRFMTIAEQAHKAGLTKRQFETMARNMAELDNQYVQHARQEQAAKMGELRTEWGKAFEQKTQRAAVIAKQLEMPESLQEALAQGNVDVSTYRWLDSMAEKFGSEGNSLVQGAGAISAYTPSEIRARRDELTRQMYSMSPSDPAYQDKLKQLVKYSEMLSED